MGRYINYVIYYFWDPLCGFGQMTVRKLRKNPKTKDILGLEVISGWDIINVAQAFSLPRRWLLKIEKVSFLLCMRTLRCYLKIQPNSIDFLDVSFIGY